MGLRLASASGGIPAAAAMRLKRGAWAAGPGRGAAEAEARRPAAERRRPAAAERRPAAARRPAARRPAAANSAAIAAHGRLGRATAPRGADRPRIHLTLPSQSNGAIGMPRQHGKFAPEPSLKTLVFQVLGSLSPICVVDISSWRCSKKVETNQSTRRCYGEPLPGQLGSSFGVDLADDSSDWHNADVGTVPCAMGQMIRRVRQSILPYRDNGCRVDQRPLSVLSKPARKGLRS